LKLEEGRADAGTDRRIRELRETKKILSAKIQEQNLATIFNKAQVELLKEREKLIVKLAKLEQTTTLDKEGNLKRILVFDEKAIENAKARIAAINKEVKALGKGVSGGLAGAIKGGLKQAGITKITSAAPKVFNINIEKLVETINNNVTNMKEGMNESKKIVTEALLTALSDTQTSIR